MWTVLRTYCFYKSNTTYQGFLSGLGCGDAKGDLEDEENDKLHLWYGER
jgi:hypothetical protein